jgi:hypothetical protein
MLSELRKVVTEVEERATHPRHGYLGDLTGDAFRPPLRPLGEMSETGGATKPRREVGSGTSAWRW